MCHAFSVVIIVSESFYVFVSLIGVASTVPIMHGYCKEKNKIEKYAYVSFHLAY